MATLRTPQPAHRRTRAAWGTRPANAASMRGLQAAMAALHSPEPGPTGDEAIALLEQQRREEEARRVAQGCLHLGLPSQ